MITSKTGQKRRITDEKTSDMFMMIYAGKRNKRIVETLQQLKVQAVGLSSIDGAIVRGKRRGRENRKGKEKAEKRRSRNLDAQKTKGKDDPTKYFICSPKLLVCT